MARKSSAVREQIAEKRLMFKDLGEELAASGHTFKLRPGSYDIAPVVAVAPSARSKGVRSGTFSGGKTRGTTGLMIDYHFGRASKSAQEKWDQFTKQFWKSAPKGTTDTGSGSGMGHADFSVDTKRPGEVTSLVRRLAKKLDMKVTVTEMKD